MDKQPNSVDVSTVGRDVMITFIYEEEEFSFTLPLAEAANLFRLLDKGIKKIVEAF